MRSATLGRGKATHQEGVAAMRNEACTALVKIYIWRERPSMATGEELDLIDFDEGVFEMFSAHVN
jgi:hypothetical protein